MNEVVSRLVASAGGVVGGEVVEGFMARNRGAESSAANKSLRSGGAERKMPHSVEVLKPSGEQECRWKEEIHRILMAMLSGGYSKTFSLVGSRQEKQSGDSAHLRFDRR